MVYSVYLRQCCSKKTLTSAFRRDSGVVKSLRFESFRAHNVLSRYIVDTMSRVMVDGKAVTVLVNGGCFSAFWWLCFPERFLVVAGYVDDVFCEHFVSFLFGCNDVFVDDDHVYACSGVASADS